MEFKNSENCIDVSIVMPCLNESETLLCCIQEASQAIEATGLKGEIIIADNGSEDGSQEIARNAGASVTLVEEKGYGNALMGGIKSARGIYVFVGDADGSYDFGELPNFLARLFEGADLVMGCRLPKGGGIIEKGAMPWKHRWIGNPVLSTLGNFFFKTSADDFHCGMRAFRRDAILGLNLQSSGMEFASEMVIKSIIADLKIVQVPITLRPAGRTRRPHLRSWRDGWRHLRLMLLFTPKWTFLIPGIVLMSCGLTGFIALFAGPLTIGDITFDTNTLLVCSAAILVGFQTIFFAIYTKVFAVREGILGPDKRVSKLLESHPVELSVGVGFMLLLVGIAYLIAALIYWEKMGFGALPYSKSLRIVIPAVTAIAMGTQTIFSGFVLGVLGLAKK